MIIWNARQHDFYIVHYFLTYEVFLQNKTSFHIVHVICWGNLNDDAIEKVYFRSQIYWNVPVLVNTGIFMVYQYYLKLWYLRSLERAGVIQKLTILERKNGLVLSNTRVPVSGTWSIPFPPFTCTCHCVIFGRQQRYKDARWRDNWHQYKRPTASSL